MKRSEPGMTILVMVSSLAVAMLYLGWRRDLLVGGSFLFADPGYYLFVIDGLLRGEVLFRDLAWPYGPAGILLPWAMARIVGNTPTTFLAAYALVMAVNIGLAFELLKRYLPARSALWLLGFVVAPAFLRVGAGGVAYFPLEISLLLVLALAWRVPHERTRSDAVRLGAVLGAMQLVKFGGAFVAGLAILLMDLTALRSCGGYRARLGVWLKPALWTLTGFVAVETVWAGLAFLCLPARIARDVVWPWYMATHYQSARAAAVGLLPTYESAGILIGLQLPGLIWLCLTLAIAVNAVRRPSATGRNALQPLAFFGVFYVIGLFVYFKHKWLIYQYLFILCVPACWMLAQCRKPLRFGIYALLAPAFLVLPYKIALKQATTEAVAMPSGHVLWLEAEEKARALKIFAALDSITDSPAARARGTRDPIIATEFGGSFHFFGRYPHLGRHVWYLPGFVRPYEEEECFRHVEIVKAVLAFFPSGGGDAMTADPKTWRIEEWSPFARSRDAALAARLEAPIKIDNHWAVFPVTGREAGTLR